MFAYLGTSDVDDVARSIPEPLLQEARRITIRDEADVMTVGLVSNRQTPISGLGAYLGFERGTEREVGPGKLILVEYAEDVGLVFSGVHSTMQLDAIVGTDQPRVVTSADRIKTKRDAPLQNG
jgi:hypothetical protein